MLYTNKSTDSFNCGTIVVDYNQRSMDIAVMREISRFLTFLENMVTNKNISIKYEPGLVPDLTESFGAGDKVKIRQIQWIINRIYSDCHQIFNSVTSKWN